MLTSPTGRPLALVTGASSGIGLELARDLAGRGFDLLLVGSSERVDEAADELGSLPSAAGTPVDVQPLRADLATYDGVEEVWSAVPPPAASWTSRP